MRRATVNTPTRKTTASMKIAMAKKAGPKWSAWATRARAITAPERMVRNMFTRPSDSWYVRARVASRLQCSVARICSAPDSIGRGGISVDIDPSLIAWKVARQVGQGLEPERKLGSSAHGLGHRGSGARVVAEVKATLFDIRTGDVDLKAGDARNTVESRSELAVFGGRLAVDIDEHRKVPPSPLRRIVADERIGARPLQTDRVEHPAGRLRDAWRRGALARPREDPLGT